MSYILGCCYYTTNQEITAYNINSTAEDHGTKWYPTFKNIIPNPPTVCVCKDCISTTLVGAHIGFNGSNKTENECYLLMNTKDAKRGEGFGIYIAPFCTSCNTGQTTVTLKKDTKLLRLYNYNKNARGLKTSTDLKPLCPTFLTAHNFSPALPDDNDHLIEKGSMPSSSPW